MHHQPHASVLGYHVVARVGFSRYANKAQLPARWESDITRYFRGFVEEHPVQNWTLDHYDDALIYPSVAEAQRDLGVLIANAPTLAEHVEELDDDLEDVEPQFFTDLNFLSIAGLDEDDEAGFVYVQKKDDKTRYGVSGIILEVGIRPVAAFLEPKDVQSAIVQLPEGFKLQGFMVYTADTEEGNPIKTYRSPDTHTYDGKLFPIVSFDFEKGHVYPVLEAAEAAIKEREKLEIKEYGSIYGDHRIVPVFEPKTQIFDLPYQD